METNSHFLKLSGKSELPEAIEIGYNYHVSLEGSITSCTESDNEDGTCNRMYTFRPVKLEILTNQGKSLKLKDTRKKTQLLRGRLWGIWKNLNTDIDFDTWYDRLMNNVIQNADEIVSMYSNA